MHIMYSNSLKSIIKNKYEFKGTKISPVHKQVIQRRAHQNLTSKNVGSNLSSMTYKPHDLRRLSNRSAFSLNEN